MTNNAQQQSKPTQGLVTDIFALERCWMRGEVNNRWLFATLGGRTDGAVDDMDIKARPGMLNRMYWGYEKRGDSSHIYAKENHGRQGFFESEDFRSVREALPDHLTPVLTFAYLTSWRKEETLG